LFACNFVVGVSSEVETSFVIGVSGNVYDGLGFWGLYTDYFLAGIIVLIAVVLYLNTVESPKKKRGK